MSIPVATTSIRILRPAGADEPYETPGTPTVVATGVRAHISTSRGTENVAGGSQEIVYFRMSCDPVDLQHQDRVEDEATGLIYNVEWARLRRGLGLDHVEAGMKQVEGAISQASSFGVRR